MDASLGCTRGSRLISSYGVHLSIDAEVIKLCKSQLVETPWTCLNDVNKAYGRLGAELLTFAWVVVDMTTLPGETPSRPSSFSTVPQLADENPERYTQREGSSRMFEECPEK